MVETVLTLLQKEVESGTECPWTDNNDRKRETEVKNENGTDRNGNDSKKSKNNSEKQKQFCKTKKRFWEAKSYGTASKKGLTLRGHAWEEAENY